MRCEACWGPMMSGAEELANVFVPLGAPWVIVVHKAEVWHRDHSSGCDMVESETGTVCLRPLLRSVPRLSPC